MKLETSKRNGKGELGRWQKFANEKSLLDNHLTTIVSEDTPAQGASRET